MSDSQPKLVDMIVVQGTLEVVTGLRIGASQDTMEISGLDNPIIRNPANAEPFLPGSSIRGRMRSLAEWYFGELPQNGDVTKPKRDSDTAHVFGVPAQHAKQDGAVQGPTRLIVRDAPLSEESRRRFREEGKPITEVKSENSINRITAMANPRPMERVLPGVTFDLEFVYRVFDIDGDGGQRDRKMFEKVFLTALALLKADALGGGASRGNGKITLKDLKRNGEPLALPELSFPASSSGRGGAVGP